MESVYNNEIRLGQLENTYNWDYFKEYYRYIYAKNLQHISNYMSKCLGIQNRNFNYHLDQTFLGHAYIWEYRADQLRVHQNNIDNCGKQKKKE